MCRINVVLQISWSASQIVKKLPMSKSIFAFTSKDGKNDGRRNELLLNVFHLNLPFISLIKVTVKL